MKHGGDGDRDLRASRHSRTTPPRAPRGARGPLALSSLLALTLAQRRPDVPLLIIEGGDRFGGDHLWSWFDSDVDVGHRWLLEPITPHHWDGHIVAFPAHSRRLKGGYNTVRSDAPGSVTA